MRGKATEKYNGVSKKGITPAYAGKSLVVAGVCYDKQDHPRLCGEKFISPQSIVTNLGSPPPMRGKGKQSLNYVDVDRITPAYAGKSLY